MEARQRVKLTGTNRSFGLIHQLPRAAAIPLPGNTELRCMVLQKPKVRLADLVVIAGDNTPDPIPNSAVKALCANGTASQDVGE